jgi:hypothetical protein
MNSFTPGQVARVRLPAVNDAGESPVEQSAEVTGP